MVFIVKRDVIAAPTTIALGTPNIYLSGLTFPATDGQWSNFMFGNPLTWLQTSFPVWIGSIYESQVSWSNGVWTIGVGGYFDSGDENSGVFLRTACTQTASSAALPLYGWTNEPWVTGGTIVISTTP
jgi:hypothetical protein